METVTSSTPDLAGLRRDYLSTELTEQTLAADWPTQFGRWLAEAVAAGLAEARPERRAPRRARRRNPGLLARA
jgi:pyridoxine/pyridoxamine 5'-phosphate oxidase